jgi:hypothetical protein
MVLRIKNRECDRLLICTGENSLKAKNTRREPRVVLSIIDFHDPYREVQLRGRVVERRLMAAASTSTPSRTSIRVSRSRFAAPKEEWRSDRGRESAIYQAPF